MSTSVRPLRVVPEAPGMDLPGAERAAAAFWPPRVSTCPPRGVGVVINRVSPAAR
jgi:hypothetical protein